MVNSLSSKLEKSETLVARLFELIWITPKDSWIKVLEIDKKTQI